MNLQRFIICIVILAGVNCSRICYDNYGCFTDKHTELALPDEPSKVNTTFILYNRANGNVEETFSTQAEPTSSYDPKLSTKFIVHGFRNSARKQWIIDMKDQILKAEDVNVITVDWSYGNGHPYSKAAGNTQIVGVDIAKLILHLMTKYNVRAEDFHLIGYSLGAHVSGKAGSLVPNIGRITALDPSGVYFEDAGNELKLDPADALFVDVIHTDVSPKLGMGMQQPIGHADFYPNEGKNQPGCASSNSKIFRSVWAWIKQDTKAARERFSCNHRSSRRFFIDSINGPCKYFAYPCKNYDEFIDGKCIQCSAKGCNQMGYWASNLNDLGQLYLNTKSLENNGSFCKQHYQIKLVSNDREGFDAAKGKFKISWKTQNQSTPTFLIKESGLKLKADSQIVALIDSEDSNSEDILEVYLSYKRTSNYLIKYFYDQYWSFKYVDVFSGQTQTVSRFCPLLEKIKSGTTAIFKKCSIA